MYIFLLFYLHCFISCVSFCFVFRSGTFSFYICIPRFLFCVIRKSCYHVETVDSLLRCTLVQVFTFHCYVWLPGKIVSFWNTRCADAMTSHLFCASALFLMSIDGFRYIRRTDICLFVCLFVCFVWFCLMAHAYFVFPPALWPFQASVGPSWFYRAGFSDDEVQKLDFNSCRIV